MYVHVIRESHGFEHLRTEHTAVADFDPFIEHWVIRKNFERGLCELELHITINFFQKKKIGGTDNSPSSRTSPSHSTALSVLRSDGGSARCRSSDSRGRWNGSRSRWDGSGWGAVGVIQAGPGDGVSRSVG